jgi:hypothetical protein
MGEVRRCGYWKVWGAGTGCGWSCFFCDPYVAVRHFSGVMFPDQRVRATSSRLGQPRRSAR